MNENNNSIWNKKKKNREHKIEYIDENFQIMNMIEKIKKVKKNRKHESMENYKNIELLQNIYDVSNNDKELINKKKNNEDENKINKEAFTDNDYDGIDRDKDGNMKDTPKVKLIQFIDRSFNAIDEFNYKKAKLIARIFSDKKETENDILLLKKYIAIFETITLSYFVSYNWFYFMFYDKENNQNNKIQNGGDIAKSILKNVIPLGLGNYLPDDLINKASNTVKQVGSVASQINPIDQVKSVAAQVGQNIPTDQIQSVVGEMGKQFNPMNQAQSLAGQMGQQFNPMNNLNSMMGTLGNANKFASMNPMVSILGSLLSSNGTETKTNINGESDNRPKQLEFSWKSIFEASRYSSLVELYLFLFEYVICYTEYLQIFLINIVPFFMSGLGNKACFIILFLTFIYILYNLTDSLRSTLIDSLNMNTSNFKVLIMFVIILCLYLPSPWFRAKSDSPADQAASSAYQALIFFSAFLLVPFFLLRCFRAFYIVTLTVPLGALMMAGYFLFYSLFGILSNNYFNPIKTYNIFNDIFTFIKDDKLPIYTEEEKKTFTFTQKLNLVANNFFDSIYKYVLYLVYIVMLCIAMMEYFKYMETPNLKTNMLIISFVLLIIFSTLCLAGFITHGINKEQ